MAIKAVIFDLDGVIVSTDHCHFKAWKRMADTEGIYFDEKINERLRGVSRMESLEIILESAKRSYSEEEKQSLVTFKNDFYKELISTLTPKDILPGVLPFLDALKSSGRKTAIGSSSKNCRAILGRIGMENRFDAVADGNDITRSKPDPEVFLTASRRLGTPAGECLVIEDADAGVSAALAGGMKVLGVGSAARNESAALAAADLLNFDFHLIDSL